VIVTGCESTQPSSDPIQTAHVSFQTSGKVDQYDCWEVWEDTDFDNLPDTNTFNVSCLQLQGKVASENIPWRYSIAITLLPAGQVEEQIVATSIFPGDNIDDFVSLTPYDQRVETSGTRAAEPPLYYLNGKRVTNASPVWLSANFIDLGTPNVMEQSPTFDIDLATGDTLIVRARKQALSDATPFLDSNEDPELSLTASVVVGTAGVTLSGEAASPSTDKAGVTFSYTRK
jgi:hypothetical protein